jgi:D-alanyl-D-alanine carboxypeptidase
VPSFSRSVATLALVTSTVAAVAGFADVRPVRAEALLLVDVETGKVLEGENATYPWYPASVTKLMTTYVTFKAVRDQRITLNTLFTVSSKAALQSPSKMGFRPGTQLTVDNALKMLLVHSANDMAVVLAEGVSGSIEKFSEEMNAAAKRLGMTQTNYVNPNGLPDDDQVTSARDLAILARALLREFPEYDSYWHIGSIRLGKKVYRNTNRLIDVYQGSDGMKTGFICASGFNLVATATRNDKRLIAVVLGASSSTARAMKAAQMLERGFSPSPLGWLIPTQGSVESLVPVTATPPNLREDICGKNHRRPAEDESEGENANSDDPLHAALVSALRGTPKGSILTSGLASSLPPVDVFLGPPNAPITAVGGAAGNGKGKKKNATGPKSAAIKPAGRTDGTEEPAAPSGEPSSTSLGLKPWPGADKGAAPAEAGTDAKADAKADAKTDKKPDAKRKPAVAAAKPKPKTEPKTEAQ